MPQCWSSGDACLALFAGDGLHYPAVIARLASSKTHAYVVYAGFEDEKPAKVALTDLQPFASASQLVAEGDDPSTTKDQTAAEPAETTRARVRNTRSAASALPATSTRKSARVATSRNLSQAQPLRRRRAVVSDDDQDDDINDCHKDNDFETGDGDGEEDEEEEEEVDQDSQTTQTKKLRQAARLSSTRKATQAPPQTTQSRQSQKRRAELESDTRTGGQLRQRDASETADSSQVSSQASSQRSTRLKHGTEEDGSPPSASTNSNSEEQRRSVVPRSKLFFAPLDAHVLDRERATRTAMAKLYQNTAMQATSTPTLSAGAQDLLLPPPSNTPASATKPPSTRSKRGISDALASDSAEHSAEPEPEAAALQPAAALSSSRSKAKAVVAPSRQFNAAPDTGHIHTPPPMDESSPDEHDFGEQRPFFPQGTTASSSAARKQRPFVLLTRTDGSTIQIPATINGYLRPYQRDGIQFLFERYRRGQGAILGDDMGLGKTIQVIGFVSALLGMTGLKRIDAFRSVHAKLKNSIPADLAPPAPHDSEPDPTSSSLMPPEYVPYNPTTEEPCFNELLDESKKGPVLIICPKAVLFNWKAEFEAWSYCKTAVCYGGTTRETAIADARARAVDVVITTYNICQNLGEEMDAVPWRCAIFDEVQKLKNPDAALSMALNRLKVRPRFGLTGTAVQNRLDEYWALLDFINKGSFGSLDQFRRLYDRPIKVGHRHDATMLELATGRRAVDNLNAEAKTFFLRRTKQLIAHQLPSKTEQIVFCHLTDLQEQAYSRLLASPELANLHESSLPCPCNKVPGKPRAQCCWVDDADHRVRRGTIFWCTTMLQKLSNHPALLIPDVCLEREAPISSRRHHTAAAAAQPGPTRGRKAAASTSSSKRAKRLDENEDDDAAVVAADHDGGELDNGDEEDTTNNNNDPFEDEEKELFQKLNDDEHIPTAIASKLTPYSANETAAAIERDMKDQAPWLVSEVGAYLDALNIPAPERQLLEALTARMHLKMIEAFQLNPLHDEHFPDDALEKRALKRFNVWRAVVCCQIAFSGDPRLLKTFLSNSPLAVTETADTSGKLKILLTLLQYYEANGDKVLIFCSSTRMLRIIEKIVMPRYNYLLLDGATSAMQRQVLVDKFQQDKSKFLFLISTRAGGVGLNLTAANVVIVFDPSWNPASDMQAQDRAFRIGQLRDVAVNRLMSQASIEEQIYGRQVYKQHLGNMALERAHERRMFTGIMGGSRSEHGDLFGAENLFAFDPEARKSSHLLARLRMAQSQALASAAPGEEDGEDAEGEVDDKVKRGAASAGASAAAPEPPRASGRTPDTAENQQAPFFGNDEKPRALARKGRAAASNEGLAPHTKPSDAQTESSRRKPFNFVQHAEGIAYMQPSSSVVGHSRREQVINQRAKVAVELDLCENEAGYSDPTSLLDDRIRQVREMAQFYHCSLRDFLALVVGSSPEEHECLLDRFYGTSLLAAIQRRDFKEAHRQLDTGANPAARDPVNDHSVLMWATSLGEIGLVTRLLQQHHVDPDR